jgi:hypothetical protein
MVSDHDDARNEHEPVGDRWSRGLLSLADRALVRHPVLALLLPYPLFLAAGFALTAIGTSTWDTVFHYQHGEWLVGQWLGEDVPVAFERVKWRGPLWEYVLAAFGAVFAFLRDPLWVRHGVTFSVLPLTLLGTYSLLRRAGETPGTALLAVALVAGNVRFLGHALVNTKDFPFACSYLLVTLLMAAAFQRRFVTPEGLFENLGAYIALVFLSIVPYLLRVPVFLHWALLVGVGLWAALVPAGPVRARRRWVVALAPVVVGPLAVFAVSPGLWPGGPKGMVTTAVLFSRFPWVGPVRLFGMEFVSTELPLWYGPAWIAVSWVPAGLLALVVGGVLFVPRVLRELTRQRPRPLQPLFGSLAVWVALFGALPWVAVLLLRPTLYDEDRHLLFAMPLLGVAAALGLRRLWPGLKAGLAVVILASALWSAASWGTYAYVYKNPLLPRASGDDFMGDYWGASTGPLAQAMYEHVPDSAYVYMMGPRESLTAELDRRETSRIIRASEPKSFNLRQRARRRGQMYVAAVNRNGSCGPLLEDVALGRARELWRGRMPGGDVAGMLVYYEDRCDDCPERLRERK